MRPEIPVFPWILCEEELSFLKKKILTLGKTIVIKETQQLKLLKETFAFDYVVHKGDSVTSSVQHGDTVFSLFLLNKNPIDSYKETVIPWIEKLTSTQGELLMRVIVPTAPYSDDMVQQSLRHFSLKSAQDVYLSLIVYLATKNVKCHVDTSSIERYCTDFLHSERDVIPDICKDHLKLFMQYFLFKKKIVLYFPTLLDITQELSLYLDISIEQVFNKSYHYSVYYLSLQPFKGKGGGVG